MKKNEWICAARRFREASSEVQDLCDYCISNGLQNDAVLRQFAFDYLVVDPQYFRSGYFVEKLLQKVKKLTLMETEKHILQELILKRIRTGAQRNFRKICRLIRLIETGGFYTQISGLAQASTPGVKRRAEFALQYCDQDRAGR